MPSWSSDQYLKFEHERTRPAVELAARVALSSPGRVIDLGCGPGNSTAVLARRWPGAALTGLDNASAMLAAARARHPDWTWLAGDIAAWRPARPYDLVFSNAALQWVPDHRRLFPRLLAGVADGGVLAVQMPADPEAPAQRAMRAVAAAPAWRQRFATPPREWHVHAPDVYYDLLAPQVSVLELWTTEYLHVLDGLDDVVEWYRGTGLRPWLDALPGDAERGEFLAAFRAQLAPGLPPRPDGRILFPFRRLFLVARR